MPHVCRVHDGWMDAKDKSCLHDSEGLDAGSLASERCVRFGRSLLGPKEGSAASQDSNTSSLSGVVVGGYNRSPSSFSDNDLPIAELKSR